MKSTGIVRKIDDLGRLVISKELRKTMNINKKYPMEIFVEGNKIILSKYELACVLCGSMDENIKFESRIVYESCTEEMNK